MLKSLGYEEISIPEETYKHDLECSYKGKPLKVEAKVKKDLDKVLNGIYFGLHIEERIKRNPSDLLIVFNKDYDKAVMLPMRIVKGGRKIKKTIQGKYQESFLQIDPYFLKKGTVTIGETKQR